MPDGDVVLTKTEVSQFKQAWANLKKVLKGENTEA